MCSFSDLSFSLSSSSSLAVTARWIAFSFATDTTITTTAIAIKRGFLSKASLHLPTLGIGWKWLALVETATGQGHTQLFLFSVHFVGLFSSFSLGAHIIQTQFTPLWVWKTSNQETPWTIRGYEWSWRSFSFQWNPSYAEKCLCLNQMWPIYKKCKLRKPSWKQNNYYATFC